jgi:hypothetical protein
MRHTDALQFSVRQVSHVLREVLIIQRDGSLARSGEGDMESRSRGEMRRAARDRSSGENKNHW